MSDFVQDYIGLGRAVERRAVPVEEAFLSRRINRHAEGPRQRQRGQTVALGLGTVGTVGRTGADASKYLRAIAVVETALKTVEYGGEPVTGYGRQNHSIGRQSLRAVRRRINGLP